MGDGEILALATRPDDLTEAAQEALRTEMASRRLQAPVEPTMESRSVGRDDPFAGVKSFAGADSYAGVEIPTLTQRAPELKPETGSKLEKGSASLMIFHDAIAAGTACDALEAEGIEINVRDVAEAHATGGSFYGGPAVALQIIVAQSDLNRAMEILRKKMGLFPGQEVEVADELVDDGSTVVLGSFGHREEADEVAQILEQATVWHRVVANPDGCLEDEDCYTLEVKEIDLQRAGEFIERAMNLPED
ncbi:MAG: DUF2007 domain-containing protein [Acidobacteriaceae bacterium]|nr:DUF2007 domain-containing protein [Acidobacteriaceae bacterium]